MRGLCAFAHRDLVRNPLSHPGLETCSPYTHHAVGYSFVCWFTVCGGSGGTPRRSVCIALLPWLRALRDMSASRADGAFIFICSSHLQLHSVLVVSGEIPWSSCLYMGLPLILALLRRICGFCGIPGLDGDLRSLVQDFDSRASGIGHSA